MSGETYSGRITTIYGSGRYGSTWANSNNKRIEGSFQSDCIDTDTDHDTAGWVYNINLSHTHNFDHTHKLEIYGGGDAEARPINYTIKVWKRTA